MFVGILAALLGADHRLSGGEVDCPYPGFHLIHILAALAAAAEGSKYHLLRIKSVGSHSFAEMKVNKPVFPLMVWPVRASADPLNGAYVFRQVFFTVKTNGAEGLCIVPRGGIKQRHIIMGLQIAPQFSNSQFALSRPLARTDLIDHVLFLPGFEIVDGADSFCYLHGGTDLGQYGVHGFVGHGALIQRLTGYGSRVDTLHLLLKLR